LSLVAKSGKGLPALMFCRTVKRRDVIWTRQVGLACVAVLLVGVVTRAAEPGAKSPSLWSLQAINVSAVPVVQDTSWPANDVDRFVLAAMEARGLKPNGPANKRALLRRATFDLTGLPPTLEEIDSFLADESPQAFEKVVDRLLASPAYGERWGRHWLDVARYADTAGDGADYPVREAYKYRNWVIDAFNRDEPYDQFIREQVAGDVLKQDASPEAYRNGVIATGYLAVSKRFGYNAASDAFHHLDIADTIDVLGRSVLGLSIGCARCHDHKYDPITMADYYGLYGIFASSQYTFPGGEETKHPDKLAPLLPPAQYRPLAQGRKAEIAAIDETIKVLSDEAFCLHENLRYPGEVGIGFHLANRGGESGSLEFAAGHTDLLMATHVRLARLSGATSELRKQRGELEQRPLCESAYAVVEGPSARNANIQLRGDPYSPAAVAPRRFLQCLGGDPLPPNAKGSGRLELSQWLTRPSNPLTPRVIVNRIWQWHFGQGLVRTPSDFGTRGEPPTHPKLLDWLASRFIADPSTSSEQGCGWSMKKLHRLLMLSRAYQMSSDDQPAARDVDPDDRMLWQFPRRRLDAEEVRDTMLSIAGTLDPTPGGEHPFPPVKDWNFTIHTPFYAVYETNRRSVYLMVQREKRHPFLSLFDGADPNLSVESRPESITPKQTLFLMNDPFVHQRATELAKRLLAMDFFSDAPRVRTLWLLATATEPSKDQQAAAGQFLEQYARRLADLGKSSEDQRMGAWAAYARVVLTSNDLLYVD
jgi:hypothetical protein